MDPARYNGIVPGRGIHNQETHGAIGDHRAIQVLYLRIGALMRIHVDREYFLLAVDLTLIEGHRQS